MIADDEARKLAEEIVLYATTKPRSNDYTEEEFTLSQAVLSLSIELTEWKIRCAELEQNAEYIKSSDEAEDLKQALTNCSVELTELRQAKESLDWLIEHKGTHLWNRYMLDNYPPYLKSRLKEKE